MTLRLATEADIEFLYACGDKFYATLDYGIKIAKDKGVQFLRQVITDENGLAVICELDGRQIGCVLGWCQDHPFAPCKIASELIWWIEPEFRGRRDSLELFNAYEYWAARRMGADIISCVSHPENKRLNKYYERKGYKPKELTFMKEFI